jgi:phosphoribosylformylglycinamidine cyclo-ligase
MTSGSYSDAGVRSADEIPAFGRMLDALRRTFDLRPEGRGRPALDFGHYANVLDLGNNLGLAISTDGVGTKILVAQMLGKYDTIGIDCVAMNVNDVVCVGAEPVAIVDYIAVERTDGALLDELGAGIAAGAEQANVAVPGGEIAQVPEMLHGVKREGEAFDLVATCVGTVALDAIVTGEAMRPGDAVVGLASSGLHSNGYTLARKVFFEDAEWQAGQHVAEFGRTLGEEMLEPTRIYVRPTLQMLAELDVRALAHITGDGFTNLSRLEAPVGFELDALPDAPAVFALLQRLGDVADEEMFRVYNMGVGFCAVVPDEQAERAVEIARSHGIDAWRIGRCVRDPQRSVRIAQRGLVSEGTRFRRA